MHRTGVVSVATNYAVNRVVVFDDHLDVGLRALRQALGDRRLSVQCHCRIDIGRSGGVVIFTGHAAVGERIAAIRGDVDLQQRLVQVQQVHGVVARLERLVLLRGEAVLAKQDDTVMIVAETQFSLGGAHAVGDVAVSLARFDLEIARQHCARQGHDDLLARGHVRRTADDATRYFVAVLVGLVIFVADVDVAPVDDLAVLLWFRGGVNHVADHDGSDELGCVNLLLFETDLHQILGKLFIGKAFRNLDVVLEPINIYHWHGSITPPSQTVR